MVEQRLNIQTQSTQDKQPSRGFVNLWQQVTKPSNMLSGEDERQANLLLNLLGASLVLNLIALVIVVSNPLSVTEDVEAIIDIRSLLVSFTALAFLLVAYVLIVF
ncbi:MAG: hypothetical protein AAFN11_20560, partial [Chloroflexota bacterium]